MGRIRQTLAWATSPGGSMHGLVRQYSSAEQAAMELQDTLEVAFQLPDRDRPVRPKPRNAEERRAAFAAERQRQREIRAARRAR